MVVPSPFLNIDAGESDDEPGELYAIAHAVSVACGGHAGDDGSMRRVVDACKAHGTRVGAHPSYPDREGFGRRALAMDRTALVASLSAQIGRFEEIARGLGYPMSFVKAHGALYHALDADPALAQSFVEVVRRLDPRARAIMGREGGALHRCASACEDVTFWREGFADRATRPDGTLVPRGEAGAVIEDPEAARARAIELARSGRFDTICVHGDTKDAVAIARRVREALDAFASAAP
jgi:UPF0271 protein